MSVQVVAYDPRWPALAAAEIDAVRDALQTSIHAIEHIGSTAVPGLAAKPIIDLMASAVDLTAVAERGDALAAIGLLPHDNGMADRLRRPSPATPSSSSPWPAAHLSATTTPARRPTSSRNSQTLPAPS